jgi:hypothetical protein
MANYNPPFAPGDKASAAIANQCEVNLGKTYEVNGVRYRLIKASATLTGVAKQAALDSGTTTLNHTIAAVTSAATHRVAGFFPVGQVDLVSGDYALVVIQGPTTAVCGTATTAGNGLVTGATGRVTDTSGTYAANAFGQLVGRALQTQTTGNDVAIIAALN